MFGVKLSNVKKKYLNIVTHILNIEFILNVAAH